MQANDHQKVMSQPNWIFISGVGKNTGKTTLASGLIEEISIRQKVIAVKTSSHFHQPTKGLLLLHKNKGYRIFEEMDQSSGKDTSKMLNAGADRAFLIETQEGMLLPAFTWLRDNVRIGSAVICESTGLAQLVHGAVQFYLTPVDEEPMQDIMTAPHNSVQVTFTGKSYQPEFSSIYQIAVERLKTPARKE